MTPNDVRLMSTKSVLEKTIAVGLVLPDIPRSVAEEHLAELEKLIETAGGTVVDRVFAKRPRPDPATYVGSGKAEQIRSLVAKTGAKLIVFDDDLSPAQARNLEKITEVKVIDRSGLILDIFAGRARSREARTQVELAQLEYMLPRLTRAWTHLERQAGGIGTRGVGETQLELDRRIVRTRIARLKDELTKIEQHRRTLQQRRQGLSGYFEGVGAQVRLEVVDDEVFHQVRHAIGRDGVHPDDNERECPSTLTGDVDQGIEAGEHQERLQRVQDSRAVG